MSPGPSPSPSTDAAVRPILCLFNADANANIEDMLGYNLYQRLHYIKGTKLIPVKSRFFLIRLLKEVAACRARCVVVTERNVYSLLGWLLKILLPRVRWVADLQDCPFKETTSYYKGRPFRWMLSYIKSVAVYRAIAHADAIVVSYCLERFHEYYRGELAKVHHFYNAIPLESDVVAVPSRSRPGRLIGLYMGSNLDGYGVNFLLSTIRRYNEKATTQLTLRIYGHEGQSDDETTYEAKVPRQTLLSALQDVDICFVPFLDGTDIQYTYPIKSIEYYCYGRKLIISETNGMRAQFFNVSSADLYFYAPGDSQDLLQTIIKCVSEIGAGISDSQRLIGRFSAAAKNARIAEIYQNSPDRRPEGRPPFPAGH